jgi:hypothetical protein
MVPFAYSTCRRARLVGMSMRDDEPQRAGAMVRDIRVGITGQPQPFPPAPTRAWDAFARTDGDAALRAAFLSVGPERKTGGSARPADSQPAHLNVLAAAEAYATRYRHDLRAQQQWQEGAPAPVRALFVAIRANTPGGQARNGLQPELAIRDPELPRLGDLGVDLQELLAQCWPSWSATGHA